MTIESNRTLGGVAAILTVIGLLSNFITIAEYATLGTSRVSVPNLALAGVSGLLGILSFIGFILFLVSMYGFSKDYQERRIFNHVIYGFIITIVAAVVAVALWFALSIGSIFSKVPSLGTQPSTADIQSIITPYVSPLTIVIGLVALIYAIFVMRAFNLIGDKSTEPMFKTGAKLVLLGGLVTVAVTTIVGVIMATGQVSLDVFTLAAVPGGFVQIAAWAVLAKAYFSIKAPPPQAFTQPNPMQPTAPYSASPPIYCSYCGAQNQPSATYCTQCGKTIKQ